VGAGPSGLATALTLLRNGVPVQIIEKNVEHRRGQRGAAMMPRSLEIYDFLEVPEMRLQGSPATPIRTYDKGGINPLQTMPMFEHQEVTPGTPYVDCLFLGQEFIEKNLRNHLAKLSCTIELGTELQYLQQFEDYVEVELTRTCDGKVTMEKISALWVIGADGARGVSVSCEQRLTTRANSVQTSAEVFGLVQILSRSHSACRAFYMFYSQILLHHQPIRPYSGPPNIRMTKNFRKGRVFLVGGTVHSPTGGQGLNSAIQDAINLGWKLALVINGDSKETLLDTFSEERVPVISQMLRLTTESLNGTINADRTRTATSFTRTPKSARPTPSPLNLWHGLMLGINYRGSRGVIDDWPIDKGELGSDPYGYLSTGSLHAGDRAPDSRGLISYPDHNQHTLFGIFRSYHHTVLIFIPQESKAESVVCALSGYPKHLVRVVVIHPQPGTGSVEGADLQLEDKEGHTLTNYGVSRDDSLRIAVVRPDGVVGDLVKTEESMKHYFDFVFQ
ncbi:FAD/NAD(P)-binding domain-containing protein, partial [Coniophora puteana RWD-64-598 SS2]